MFNKSNGNAYYNGEYYVFRGYYRDMLTDEMKETLIYIARHLKYPTDAFEKGIQGKVVLELHLTEHEHLNTVKVIESVAPSLDAEAIRIIKETPLWKKNHENTTKLLMPVIFRLM